MHYQDDAKYRLKLAKGFLKEAEEDVKLGRWRSCVDNAQLAVENSGKAILCIFGPLEKTHEPSLQLKRLLKQRRIPEKLISRIEEIIPLLGELGSDEHFLTDYGDEESSLSPWELFSKEDADKAIKIARRCLKNTKGVCKTYFQK